VAGFILIVALWVGAIVDLAFRVREVDRQLDAMTDRFIRTEDALQTIRTTVLLAAIDWRDAFLDLEPGQLDYYRGQLASHREEGTRRLAELRIAEEASSARDAVAALEREVNAYWAGVLPLVGQSAPRQAADVRRILNERVIPKRAQVIRIVQQVQQINRARLQRQQRETANVYARAQARVAATGGIATLLSLVVGALVFTHVTSLERQLRAELAANAAITADLHRLSTRLVRAQEDERRLIARELHDEVGQALTAVKLQLAVVRRHGPPASHGAVDEARDTVDAALQSARHLSRLLHPPMLDDMGLAAAVEWYLRSYAERTGIAAAFEHAGTERRASPEIETCLYRVVQEATTNVAKHAHAANCRVYLQRLPSSVVLTVEDDGGGFDATSPQNAQAGGLGLLGIKERVEGFRGLFHLETAPGHGTRLTVELPALDEQGDSLAPRVAAEDLTAEPTGEAGDGTDSSRG
jgi:signal transduction histidine kinase